jgi:hypothetical protein
MTIRIPKKSFADKILDALGKKRGVKIPEDVYEKFGPYVYAQARKESFWRALFRSRHAKLPEGYVYIDDLQNQSV